MPFRQLPATILSRKNVLEKTKQKVSSTEQSIWAISSETKQRLSSLYPKFSTETGERQEQFAKQAEASKDENRQQSVLHQYVSHFFRVFNFAVERGKFKESDRLFYGLNANQNDLPKLTIEQELVTWAKNIITGEQKRLSQSNDSKTPAKNSTKLMAMSNPSSNEIQQELDKYILLSNKQSAEKQAFDSENKDVLNMLPEIDDLIRDIYDEVEFYYRKEASANKRKLARQWGVVYVTRKDEVSDDEILIEELD